MKNVFWQSGQRIIKQILDFLNTSIGDSNAERRQDYSDPGILLDELNDFDIIEGTNNTPSTPSITVRTGVGYDVNGDRITVDDENISYDPTNPSDTTDDGLGNPITTPHSTGSLNISLTVNVNNFIWIDYLEVTDETEFTLQKITNAKQFYKKDNGYLITVTTVDTPPTVNSLKLGNVELTGGGVVSGSTISLANRLTSAIKEKRVKGRTALANKSDATAIYAPGQSILADDHFLATGGGIVAPNNPHGLGPEDLGLSPAQTVQEHQQFLHTSGIIGNPTTTSSSLFPVINSFNPGEDILILKALLANERVNIDGFIILDTDLLIDTELLFNALDSDGTYFIFLDKNTKQIEKTLTDLVASPDVTKFLLCTVDWTFPGATSGDLTNLVDKRAFGTVGFTDIQTELPHFVLALLTGTYPIVSNITYSATNFNVLTSDFSGTDVLGVEFSYFAALTYSPNNDDINAVLISSIETFIYGIFSITTNTTYAYDGNDNLITVTRV